MIVSNKLSPERMAEIRAFKDKPDPECPPMNAEDFAKGHFRNPEAAQKAIEAMRREKAVETIEVSLDSDIAEWLKKSGQNYSYVLNTVLREVLRLGRITASL
jgi:uncharacterized protein (DUF4415 family)